MRLTLSALAWGPGVALPTAEANAAAVSDGGTIFLIGGGSATVRVLYPGATAWGNAGQLDEGMTSPGAGLDTKGILVYGGKQETPLNSAFIFNPSLQTAQTAASMATARADFAYATDSSGFSYAFGGLGANHSILAVAERYNPGTGAWQGLQPLPQPLYGADAVSDGGDHILVIGGATTSAANSASSAVYEYTISTNTWTTLPSLPVAVSHSAVVFGTDGQVYVIGGVGASGTVGTVQVFDPAGQTWSTAASLPNPVSNETAAIDSVGRIEVIGGLDASQAAVTNVYESQILAAPYAAPTFVSNPLPNGSTGNLYSYQPSATGNPTWVSYSLMTAPNGMTMDSNTGLVTWTPTASQTGIFNVDVRATNLGGSTDQNYTITVRQSPPTTPTGLHLVSETATTVTLAWNASTDPSGPVTYTVYHFYVTGHSGRGGGITQHYDPVGSNLTGTSFTVTGLAPGTQYYYTVKAFDSANLSSSYAGLFSVTTDTLPVFTGQPSGTTFQLTARHAFTMTLTASGNPIDFAYSIVNPPNGMTVNAATGVVSWTPADNFVGTTSVTFQVSSSAGTGGTVAYNFAVAPNLPVPVYKSANLVNGTLYAVPNRQLSVQLADSSSNSAVTWSLVSGPRGMTVNSTTGAVIWTPPTGTPLGTVNATFQATNYAGSAGLTMPISVVFASAPRKLIVSNLSSTAGGDSGTITWMAPAAASAAIKKFEVLVTQPGGPTGRYTTTYTLSGSARKFVLTGLGASSLIGVQVIAVDAAGDLGIPQTISFVSP